MHGDEDWDYSERLHHFCLVVLLNASTPGEMPKYFIVAFAVTATLLRDIKIAYSAPL